MTTPEERAALRHEVEFGYVGQSVGDVLDDLDAAEATIAAKDAEIARLREHWCETCKWREMVAESEAALSDASTAGEE